MLLPLLIATVFAGATPASDEPVVSAVAVPASGRVFVFSFRGDGIEDKVLRAIQRDTAAATAALGYEVVSSDDIATLLDVEAARQSAQCDSDSSCLSELAGSLGATLVVTGRVVELGGQIDVALTLLDTSGAKVLARSTAAAADVRALRADTENATRRLFGATVVEPSGPNMGLVVGGAVVGVVGLFGALGLVPYVAANQHAVDAAAAADRYAKSGDDDDLRELHDSSAAHQREAQTFNTLGIGALAAGSTLVVVGIALVTIAFVAGE